MHNWLLRPAGSLLLHVIAVRTMEYKIEGMARGVRPVIGEPVACGDGIAPRIVRRQDAVVDVKRYSCGAFVVEVKRDAIGFDATCGLKRIRQSTRGTGSGLLHGHGLRLGHAVGPMQRLNGLWRREGLVTDDRVLREVEGCSEIAADGTAPRADVGF